MFVIKVFLSSLFSFDATGYVLAILSLICIFPPQKNYMALLLFFVWPYFPEVPKLPMGLFVLWLFVVWAEAMIPFGFLYCAADELKKFLLKAKKQNFFVYNLIFLLPTLVLLIGEIWHCFEKQRVYYDKLNPSGLSVVCSEKECRSWEKEPKTFLIRSDSVLGDTLQKMYQGIFRTFP